MFDGLPIFCVGGTFIYVSRQTCSFERVDKISIRIYLNDRKGVGYKINCQVFEHVNFHRVQGECKSGLSCRNLEKESLCLGCITH